MNTLLRKKLFIVTIILLSIIILPKNYVFAETITNDRGTYTYSEPREDDDGPDVETLRFQITYYGATGEGTLCGTSPLEFQHQNEIHGWNEIEIDGEYYAVIAAATHYMHREPPTRQNYQWFWSKQFDHIHYFRTEVDIGADKCERIEFKFEDESFDSNVYKGAILDTGGPQMFPQYYTGFEPDVNILDFYYTGGDVPGVNLPKANEVNGKIILVSMDGSFGKNAKSGSNSEDEISLADKIANYIAEMVLIPAGDTIQKLLDQAGADLTEKDANTILYTRQNLESINNIFYKEIQIDSVNKKVDVPTLKDEEISNVLENKNTETEEIFTSTTMIPAIPMDIYSMTATQVKLFDLDFLNNNTTNDNKAWLLYRNIVNSFSHIVVYICSALLMGMIIWRSILLTTSISINNPKIALESRKIIDNFVNAIVVIVGVYLFSALMISTYKYFTSIATGGSLTRFPIRLTVKDVYAFNTNSISIIRYYTQSSNISQKFGWSLLYFFIAFLNALWFGFMYLRMIIMGALIIIAPINAVTTMVNTSKNANQNGILSINGWMKLFSIVLWIPFGVTLIISIALRI